MMKFTRTALAGLLILAATGTSMAGWAQTSDLIGTEWRPVKIGNTAVYNLTPYFRFNEDRKVIGHGGCNGFGGMYRLGERRVKFKDLYSTLMLCPPAIMNNERGFLRALRNAKRLKRNGSKLVLIDNAGRKLAEFTQRH